MQKEKPPVSKNTRATDKEAMKDAAATALTDINRATLEELKAIPEIGEEYAAAVVKGRPYKNKGQLVARKVLPEGIYKKIKERIVARP